jgi:AAHS family cis,cis-muconate transporter-like MFS transporter
MMMHSRVPVFLVWLVTFVAYSVAYTTFGSSIAVLAEVLALGPIEIGALASALSVGFLTTFPGGILSDKIDKRMIVSSGLAVSSVGLAAIGLSSSFVGCFLSAVLLGIGAGVYEAAMNPLVLELFPERRAFALGSAHLCWGVGGFIGPLLVGYAYSTWFDWRLAFYVTSILVVVGLVAFLAVRAPATSQIDPNVGQQNFRLTDLKSLWRLMFGNLLAWGIEGSIVAWLIIFLTTERGLDFLLATSSLSIFFLLQAVGKPIWGIFADKYGYVTAVKICSGVGGIVLFSAIVTSRGILPLVLMAPTGFLLGGVIPNLTTAACSRFQSASGAASGMINLAGDIGSIILPFVFGVVVAFSNAFWGFVWVSSLAVLVAFISK